MKGYTGSINSHLGECMLNFKIFLKRTLMYIEKKNLTSQEFESFIYPYSQECFIYVDTGQIKFVLNIYLTCI